MVKRLLAVALLCAGLAHAQTKLDLANQVKGVLPAANGGTSTTSIPTCADTGGQHLNYASGAFACGTSGTAGIPGGTPAQVQYNNSGAFGGFTVGGDATLNTGTGALTVTKTSNVAFAASATTDTTNAGNISSGTLNTARLPSPFTSGTRSGNTTTFATTSGTLTSTHCAKFDASGNIIDSGSTCGGGSGPTLITTLTASTSANLQATGLTGYSSYEFRFHNVTIDQGSDYILMVISQDNGGTYKTGGSDYRYAWQKVVDSGATALDNNQATSSIAIGRPNDVISDGGMSGVVRCFNFANAVKHLCSIDVTWVQTSVWVRNYGFGAYQTDDTAINAVKFFATSGNLKAGFIEVWGIP